MKPIIPVEDCYKLISPSFKSMAEAAENNDINKFFKLYSEYLEQNGLISASRIIIWDMCKKVAECDLSSNNSQ